MKYTWFLYYMVAHFNMHTYEVNQAFGFVKGIWLHRKNRQIRFFFVKRPYFHHSCATVNEQPSTLKTMGLASCFKHTKIGIQQEREFI